MKPVQFILACLAAVIPAAVSFGDMVGGPRAAAPAVAAPAASADRPAAALGELSRFGSQRSSLLPAGVTPLGDLADAGGSDEPAPVIELPPAPSSASLALSGLAGVVAVWVYRSSRQWNLAALPEWYHGACPDQIGHATPAPFDLALSLQPVCVFLVPPARPDADTAITRFDPHRDIASRLRSQFTLPAAAPRGPPSLA